MWAFAGKAESRAQGTRLAEWMFSLKPAKKTRGSRKKASCRTGKQWHEWTTWDGTGKINKAERDGN